MRITNTVVVAAIGFSLVLFSVVFSRAAKPNDVDSTYWSVWFPKPPSDCVIAGNLISGGKWYPLDGSQIQCVKKVLAQEPLVFRTTGVPTRRPNSLILWKSEGRSLVAVDRVTFSNFTNGNSIFYSESGGHFYRVKDSKGYKPLVELMDRIHAGHETPLNDGVLATGSDQTNQRHSSPANGGHRN